VTSCNLVETYRRFGVFYCLRHSVAQMIEAAESSKMSICF